MNHDNEFIEVEDNHNKYYITKCYTLNSQLRKRHLNKSDLISFVKDENEIIKTYCVLEKGNKFNEYFVVNGCNLNNKNIEEAIEDFFKHIFKKN